MNKFKNNLAEVFRDARKHLEVAGIIADHLTCKCDVRDEALNNLELKHAGSILDLGCGFGFFTRALQGRVGCDAAITGIDRYPEYEQLYLESCKTAGLKGNFRGSGISALSEIPGNSIDLVICSYAMYFFPWIIPELMHKLKPYALFVIITHAIPHMREFTNYVRSILRDRQIEVSGQLPYEKLIGQFSNRNACEQLDPYFNRIERKRFTSKLLFNEKDYDDFVKYFRFKHRFFIPKDSETELEDFILKAIKNDMKNGKSFKITKDDMIFICSHPQKDIKQ
ncbi:MAG: class I SAM-dependent methyltransferase [Bacteroidota bacterium]|nr:class I SAM-dependent methyltransferase [Bacteroidota bacterium]